MISDSDSFSVRLDKLARLRELGADPYAVEKFDFSASIGELIDDFKEGETATIAGRVISMRPMGKAAFAHISDGERRIQAYVRKDDLGDLQWSIFDLIDIGDHVGIRGELFVTKTGEQSIHVRSLTPLSKCLRSLPIGKEKDGHIYYGLEDIEMKYRHRHLDLLASPESRKMLIDRSRIISAVRRYFESQGYIEVETPMLQIIAGGASARPFLTHFNAYDVDVKLRISLELYLKRLICGDIPRVFEIGRVFRNEGVSSRHNPEFTLLEFYEAYANLETMQQRVQECFSFVAQQVFGTSEIVAPQEGSNDVNIDFSQNWARVDLLDEISRLLGIDRSDFESFESASNALKDKTLLNKSTGKSVRLEAEKSLGGLIEKLLDVFLEPTLIQPTFVIGYPIETSPLAKKDPENPRLTRRFEGYVLGREVCNAFSEINDPIDQRERFEEQANQLATGNEEAHPMDQDFLYALECGMPPTGGCGIGMDRFAMLLTGASSLREILLFPMMKTESRMLDRAPQGS